MKTYFSPMELKIIEQYGQILNKFRIMHHEWEMDGYGYIVTKDGVTTKLIITDHGKPIESVVDYLRSKIDEYENTIKETRDIIDILTNSKYSTSSRL
jgi:hypothetical protein